MAVSSNKTSLTLSPQGVLQVHDNSQQPPELVWQSNTTDVSYSNRVTNFHLHRIYISSVEHAQILMDSLFNHLCTDERDETHY